MQQPNSHTDIELAQSKTSYLVNDAVRSLSWKDLHVTVKDHRTREPLDILFGMHGSVEAGEMLAIMGPSGCGKTTLLNVLASREATAGASTRGDVLVDGKTADWNLIRELSSFVEQEDALVGSLTVRETVNFAAGLSLSRRVTKKQRVERIDELIHKLGLRRESNTIVGTPMKKGLSGGQKKRLSVASSLVSRPAILFLDEPTSGLDSATSFEVMNFVRSIAKETGLIVVASIHQPSTSTFQLFDKLCLISRGKTCFFGPTQSAPEYFQAVGHPVPTAINPAEFYLDLIATDTSRSGDGSEERVAGIQGAWTNGTHFNSLKTDIDRHVESHRQANTLPEHPDNRRDKPTFGTILLVLLHRSWIKAYRDIITYGVRLAMYLGLAIMMGTVFLRLKDEQKYIQPFINAIFFGGAFLSFMAVAYVPAFLEDRATFVKERNNGLVGPLAFVLSNFLIGLPFLFTITILFSIVEYWLTGFRNDGHSFFMFVLWLFLDLLAAESLVVLVSAVFPIFVVALAIAAFANGLWMCVDGFLVPMNILNPFWKYVFHYIDYQAYVFQGMMVNEFQGRTYACAKVGEEYQCMYPSTLNQQGRIEGSAVLRALDISLGKEGEWIGIMVAIIFVYRVLGFVVLWWKKR